MPYCSDADYAIVTWTTPNGDNGNYQSSSGGIDYTLSRRTLVTNSMWYGTYSSTNTYRNNANCGVVRNCQTSTPFSGEYLGIEADQPLTNQIAVKYKASNDVIGYRALIQSGATTLVLRAGCQNENVTSQRYALRGSVTGSLSGGTITVEDTLSIFDSVGNLLFSKLFTNDTPNVSVECITEPPDDSCPENTCQVDCGTHYCCYGSDGIAVHSYLK